MRLVNDDCKSPVLIICRDVVQDELELVDNGNNDLLALIQKCMKIRGRLCPAYRGGHLCKLSDGIFYLLIKVDTVGNDNDRVKYIFTVTFDADKLMRQPCD